MKVKLKNYIDRKETANLTRLQYIKILMGQFTNLFGGI